MLLARMPGAIGLPRCFHSRNSMPAASMATPTNTPTNSSASNRPMPAMPSTMRSQRWRGRRGAAKRMLRRNTGRKKACIGSGILGAQARRDTMAASIRGLRIRVVSSSLNRDAEPIAAPLLRLEAIEPDSLHEVEAVLDGDAESLIVHRDAAGAVRAWLNVCPHAGRRLDWAPGRFLRGKDGLLVCAVHGAS